MSRCGKSCVFCRDSGVSVVPSGLGDEGTDLQSRFGTSAVVCAHESVDLYFNS